MFFQISAQHDSRFRPFHDLRGTPTKESALGWESFCFARNTNKVSSLSQVFRTKNRPEIWGLIDKLYVTFVL